ncbi:uncharacterized protein LOC108033305 [Drosophila biarmipes]|uniref:uncharacterized protein LOC108033305 n=1 Tax=Drosophila biarmipes TaxID=125945 RepID=UPI0007E61F31|nr:uncharacterized protein LOC108033305 [Drosophila biarmipes]
MRDYIRNCIRSHRCLSVFTVLQLTLMLSILEVRFQFHQSPQTQRPMTHVYVVGQLSELARSLLFSGFAMGAMFYGYGLIHLPIKGALGGVFSRLRITGLAVWQRCSPLMLLPWSMKVVQGLSRFPFHMWECLAKEPCLAADNFLWFLVLTALLWIHLVILAIASFVVAVRLNLRMLGARHIRSGNHELRAYAQEINELLGFEMIVMTG